MNFNEYYDQLSPAEKSDLARKLATSKTYLSQIRHGHRNAGSKYLLNIERVTGGAVKASGLRSNPLK